MTLAAIRGAAIDAILDHDHTRLDRLDRKATAILAGPCCPDCGGRKIEDNGVPATHWDLTYLCTDCHAQWCPNA